MSHTVLVIPLPVGPVCSSLGCTVWRQLLRFGADRHCPPTFVCFHDKQGAAANRKLVSVTGCSPAGTLTPSEDSAVPLPTGGAGGTPTTTGQSEPARESALDHGYGYPWQHQHPHQTDDDHHPISTSSRRLL